MKKKHGRFIRIQSDGDGPGTIITDAEGKVIENVIDASIYLSPHEVNRVQLTIMLIKTDVHANVDGATFECPFCEQSILHDCTPPTIGGS